MLTGGLLPFPRTGCALLREEKNITGLRDPPGSLPAQAKQSFTYVQHVVQCANGPRGLTSRVVIVGFELPPRRLRKFGVRHHEP